MASEFMPGFYVVKPVRQTLLRCTRQLFLRAWRVEFIGTAISLPPIESVTVATHGQNLHLFQMIRGIDKIPRRDTNRATNVCLVSLTTRNSGVLLHEIE